jgi:hypothetical protein
MKKILATLSVLALFFVMHQSASAQFNFFNATPCFVRILGGFNYAPNPCAGPTCSTPWTSVAPFSSVTLTGAGVTCLSPSFPPPPANFFGYKLVISSTSATSVDICNNPVSSILDCNGMPRTVQIFSFNSGAIF